MKSKNNVSKLAINQMVRPFNKSYGFKNHGKDYSSKAMGLTQKTHSPCQKKPKEQGQLVHIF